MASIPLDRTFREFVTTNVTINLFGPWKSIINPLPASSNLVRINCAMAIGDNAMADKVSFNIGVGPTDPPTIKIEELVMNHEQVGAFSGHGTFGDFLMPVSFAAGSRIWAQVKGLQGGGGAFNYQLQIVFMTQQ